MGDNSNYIIKDSILNFCKAVYQWEISWNGPQTGWKMLKEFILQSLRHNKDYSIIVQRQGRSVPFSQEQRAEQSITKGHQVDVRTIQFFAFILTHKHCNQINEQTKLPITAKNNTE